MRRDVPRTALDLILAQCTKDVIASIEGNVRALPYNIVSSRILALSPGVVGDLFVEAMVLSAGSTSLAGILQEVWNSISLGKRRTWQYI